MKKKRVLKGWVKVSIIIIIAFIIIIGLTRIINNVRKENRLREAQLVEQYIQCLNDNFTQRKYCADQVGSEYHYMDLVIKNYGYNYIQIGYDLYVVKNNEE